MANFPVDSLPFVPDGFTLVPRAPLRVPVRSRVFLGHIDRLNEDLAIAITEPKIAKEDFIPFAHELRHYLEDNQVHLPEIQPCPTGEAFVRFANPVQQEAFLSGPIRQLGGYQLRFIHHDEGCNFTDMPLDRIVWLLLLCYPPDARSVAQINKSIGHFAHLLYVHGSTNQARIVVKVVMNHEEEVPESITVTAGSCPKGRSWTVPVYIIKEKVHITPPTIDKVHVTP